MVSLQDLKSFFPNTWEDEYNQYKGRNFQLYDVNDHSVEFYEIQNFIINERGSDVKVSNIKRIQHPFAFARFLLRKEQLQKRNSLSYSHFEFRMLKDVSRDEVKTLIEYNLDDRRKKSSFLIPEDSKCFIVFKALSHAQERDSERYPEYVANFE